MSDAARTVAARAFVRSVNTLLKFTRLYTFEHARSKGQLEVTWNELQSAVRADADNGVLLSAFGTKLLLDGVPMDSTAAGRAFAQMLSSSGIASVHFLPQVTREELSRFAQAFPTGGAKPESLLEKLQSALGARSGIRINEVRFVREDSATPDTKIATQLMMRTLGADAAELKAWFDDPQKLLQLILAAETSPGESGTARNSTTGAIRAGVLASPHVSSTAAVGELTEEHLHKILGLLKTVASKAPGPNRTSEPQSFQEGVSKLPVQAQFSLQAALASLAAQAPSDTVDQPTLLRLAEHLAVQFALAKVESGDARAGAVHQMFIRMSRELENLREVIGAHEEKLSRAGIAVESYSDAFGGEIWRQVSDEHKKSALLSAEAWCCPPKVVRQFVQGLSQQGDEITSYTILQNYASCITGEDAETRRCAAMGVAELADLYGKGDGSLLIEALSHAGTQLAIERDAQMHALVSAAFVRLTQEAAVHSCYPALVRALDLLSGADRQRPGLAQSVGPRLGIEDRLPRFIEQVMVTGRIPAALRDVLRRMPERAAMVLANQFNRCAFHDECESLIEVAASLGPEGATSLCDTLGTGPAAEALETTGLLSRLNVSALEEFLPSRLREWNRSSHDRLVRQIAAAGSPERARILRSIFEKLDPLVQPLALDEVGMSGEESLSQWLLGLADETSSASPYLRLKAVEALSRLRAENATPLLRRIVETKRRWRWANPTELRIVALQGLDKLDPEWVRGFLEHSGIKREELNQRALDADPYSGSIRQRRYDRIRMKQSLRGETTNLSENARLEIRELSLGGGLATCERSLPSGTAIELKIEMRWGATRLQAFVRRSRAHVLQFEIADISLEDRAKLRRFIAEAGDTPQPPPLQARKRRASVEPHAKR